MACDIPLIKNVDEGALLPSKPVQPIPITNTVDSVGKQFIRYGFVGAAAAFVDLNVLYLFTTVFHFHYLLSNIVAFCCGLTTNYILSIFWVFTSHTFKSKTVEFLIFTAIGIVGLGINELVLWACTELCGMYFMISKVFGILVVFLWNFFVRKFVLFK
ncbi:MAG: GtrA family protein [Chitinivibrionales bacterium]|nr:GtrA family protein [Chitinivibrionales bacterium]